jgi:mannose-1-phosphate guanylyltransferase/mannose-1-phosphate guanylyltransferase/mannose-6-phosphate isomerase
MVKAGFSWTDVGSWDEYARHAKHISSEVYGTKEALNTCFVDSDIPVALCGVEDLIVVMRSGGDGAPPALLISKKGKTQHVKDIVEQIKAAGREELL